MEYNLGTPNPKQEIFLTDTHRHVAFGGARGGGKSWAIRVKAVILACLYPGIKIMIIRRTYPELLANHVRPFKQMLKIGTKACPIKYKESEKIMTFPNGSTILFGYCQTESDTDRYQGTEVDILFIDEATQLTQQQIEDLNACVRSTNPNFPLRTYYTCNPGGKGHGYIKRLFVDRDFINDEDPDDYAFIQSRVYDNTELMTAHPEYIKTLENLPEAKRLAWLEGRWDVFVGQVFSEWRNNYEGYATRLNTHVIDDFEIDDSWKVYRGFDYGYAKPFAVVWIAVDHNNRLYVIREYYGCTSQPDTGVEMEPTEIARRIKEIEATDPVLMRHKCIGIADPAIWQKTTGESISQLMERERVTFMKGDNTRLAGLMQLHYRLRFNDNGIPMLYVFKSCKNVIRTIPTLIYDEKKPEEVDTTLEDHLYDAIRYVCMENPINPQQQRVWHPPKDDPLDLYKMY